MLADAGFDATRTENSETVECSPSLLLEPPRGEKRPFGSDGAPTEMDMMLDNIAEGGDIGPKRLKLENANSVVDEPVGLTTQDALDVKPVSTIVDLTKGKNFPDTCEYWLTSLHIDDDVIYVSTSKRMQPMPMEIDSVQPFDDGGDKEIWLGYLDGAIAIATFVPSPSMSQMSSMNSSWPQMKATLREAQARTAFSFDVLDPQHFCFAELNLEAARPLKRAKDESNGKLRHVARIPPRRKGPFEVPGNPCRTRIPLEIEIFAPKKYASVIREIFKRHKARLVDDYGNDCERAKAVVVKDKTFEEAEKQKALIRAFQDKVTKTAAEVGLEATKILTEQISDENMPVMEQDGRVRSKLMKHQMQALYFMTEREKNPYEVPVEEKYRIWREFKSVRGPVKYHNLVTGENSPRVGMT
jgi:hypothetical protein